MLLHELEDFADLVAVVAREQQVHPGLVEKDYWIMQALWGLQQQGFRFALKGGTSLSKGFGLIQRFSEDIDLLVEPDGELPTGKNQNSAAQVRRRERFYDDLAGKLVLPGFHEAIRERSFDDRLLRSAGIRMNYPTTQNLPDGVKAGILLEVGFDQVVPNRPCLISSWAYDKAASLIPDLIDHRAKSVACYEPGFTLVEKLQTLSTKFRNWNGDGTLPPNFLRHYYDVYCLLADSSVQEFVGTACYLQHKKDRFPAADEVVISANPAFQGVDSPQWSVLEHAFSNSRSLYYRGQPSLEAIFARIREWSDRL